MLLLLRLLAVDEADGFLEDCPGKMNWHPGLLPSYNV